MAQIYGTSLIGPGVNIIPGADEFVFVSEGVTRGSTNNMAIQGTLGGANIQVLGTLVGDTSGMRLVDNADSTGNYNVTIGSSGSVIGVLDTIIFEDDANSLNNQGFISSSIGFGVYNLGGADFSLVNSGTISSNGATAVFSDGSGAHIINHGLIESAGVNTFDNAVKLYDNDPLNNVELTNYGTLSAIGGVAVEGDGNDTDLIHNFGTIIGDVKNLGGEDQVDNSGIIQGNVWLGDGLDTYNGEGGRVTGIIYGGNGSDLITGGDYADNIHGDSGFDTLIGGGGADQLYGGANDDNLIGGKGADILDGGSGFDTADYSASLGAVQVNLQTGAASSFDAAGDSLFSIENLNGSSDGDYLAGDAGVNMLVGLDGNDSLYGRVGADFLFGGAGDDRLFGGMDNDSIDGGYGDDWMVGGGGADAMNGGDGFDTADYSASSGAVTMNLDTNIHSGGDATGDSLISVEAVIGSTFADDIAGSHADNVMEGGKGQDRLQGRWGADDLRGGGGNDRLYGGVDNDKLNGGTGNDKLYGGGGDDMFIFEDSFGNDKVMDFSNGSEMLDVSAVTGATTATFHVSGGGASNVMVDFGGLDSIEFVGITNAALITVDDFIF